MAVLATDGSVYTWGRGGYGRLGHGDQETHEVPRLVTALRGIHVTYIACGFAFSAAVTSERGVYTWGTGDCGRLGLGDEKDRFSPTFVEALMDENIACIQAGNI